MTITKLRESDSGRYGCGLKTSYHEFEIIVTDGEFTLKEKNERNENKFFNVFGGDIFYCQLLMT